VSNRTLLALVAAGAVLYLVWRARQAGAQPLFAASQNINDLIQSPEQRSAYWALMASGVPSEAGSRGAGTTTPGTITAWLGRVFPGGLFAYSGPSAGTGAKEQTSSALAGAFVAPGPVPPSSPTGQSAVESSSRWLPESLRLASPASSNPWFTNLTFDDPLAVVQLGGDFIDVKVLPESDLIPTRA